MRSKESNRKERRVHNYGRINRRRGVLDGGSWKRTKRGALIALPPVSVLSFLVFPAVSSIAFRAWDCVYFDKDTELERSFLRSDLRIECETPAHDDILRLAYLGIVLYPVFIPLAYLFLLFSARGAIVKDRPTRLSTALAFLHRYNRVFAAVMFLLCIALLLWGGLHGINVGARAGAG